MSKFSLCLYLRGLFTCTLLILVPLRILHAGENPEKLVDKQVITVGFSQDTLANDWRQAQVSELQKGFARYPNFRFIFTDAQGSTAKQIQDVEDLINRGVDILITSPRDERAMTPIISRVYKQGIPVILLTRRVVGEDYTTFIAPDDQAIARNAARYIAAKLHHKASILMLQGVPTASTAIARTNGFTKELEHYPHLSLSAIKTANYLRSDAIRAVEEAIQQGLKFDAIFAQSDSMASGARIALKKAYGDSQKVLIVGIDYINEARTAIRNGQQSASFTYPTCAREAVETVIAISRGESVAKNIRVTSRIVTRENVEKVKPIF